MAGGEGTLTGSVAGAYQIGERIGAGPLAEVYQAWRHGQSQPVALKVFAPAIVANAPYVQTMREILARVSQLETSHILPVHDFAQQGEILYLAMPQMRESLRTMLTRAGVLPLHRAVPLLRQIAHGLSAAHAAGIIHRDLKPENVLLNATGQAFVSDFGVGRDLPPEKIEHHSLNTLASLIGTPAYMAPEQLRGQPTDQRTDVYALAIILYEMLTGEPPYSGNTIYEVAAQALTLPIPPPSQHTTGVSPLLERAILRALARDPAKRWPTVQRFTVGLDAALPTRADALDVAPDNAESTRNRPRHEATPVPRAPLPPERLAYGVADEAVADEVPTTRIFGRSNARNTTQRNEQAASSGKLVVPDLRLFRVDPLPPLQPDRRPTKLLLAALAVLLLAALGLGSVLLVNAAQPSHSSGGATPISPTATLAPTGFNNGPPPRNLPGRS